MRIWATSSSVGQRTRVDCDLAEVVEAGGSDKPLGLAPRQVERCDESLDQLRNPFRVLRGGRIPGVDNVCHCLKRPLRLTPKSLEVRPREKQRSE